MMRTLNRGVKIVTNIYPACLSRPAVAYEWGRALKRFQTEDRNNDLGFAVRQALAGKTGWHRVATMPDDIARVAHDFKYRSCWLYARRLGNVVHVGLVVSRIAYKRGDVGPKIDADNVARHWQWAIPYALWSLPPAEAREAAFIGRCHEDLGQGAAHLPFTRLMDARVVTVH